MLQIEIYSSQRAWYNYLFSETLDITCMQVHISIIESMVIISTINQQ